MQPAEQQPEDQRTGDDRDAIDERTVAHAGQPA